MEIDKDFEKMKKTIGTENYDTLNIISTSLLSNAIGFMRKMGILEEFLRDKNEISKILAESILKDRKEKGYDD